MVYDGKCHQEALDPAIPTVEEQTGVTDLWHTESVEVDQVWHMEPGSAGTQDSPCVQMQSNGNDVETSLENTDDGDGSFNHSSEQNGIRIKIGTNPNSHVYQRRLVLNHGGALNPHFAGSVILLVMLIVC